MSRLLCLLLLLSYCLQGNTQRTSTQSHKYSIQGGFGASGSFFVKSYEDNFSGVTFYQKNFIGKTFNIGVAREIGNDFVLALNYSFQQFSKRISYNEQLDNVELIISDFSIRHINNIYDLTLRKHFGNAFGSWMVGLGLYYLRPIQQEVSIYGAGPATIQFQERRYKNSKLEEGGSLAEVGYEYKFQPRMLLGIKTQLFYTISTQEFESISLFPYLKYTF